jgi:hypothetical protein
MPRIQQIAGCSDCLFPVLEEGATHWECGHPPPREVTTLKANFTDEVGRPLTAPSTCPLRQAPFTLILSDTTGVELLAEAYIEALQRILGEDWFRWLQVQLSETLRPTWWGGPSQWEGWQVLPDRVSWFREGGRIAILSSGEVICGQKLPTLPPLPEEHQTCSACGRPFSTRRTHKDDVCYGCLG